MRRHSAALFPALNEQSLAGASDHSSSYEGLQIEAKSLFYRAISEIEIAPLVVLISIAAPPPLISPSSRRVLIRPWTAIGKVSF